MNKNISMLMIAMSLFGVIQLITLGYENVDIVIRITCIIGICILEVLSNFLKVNEKYISIIQLISILFLEIIDFYGMIFLLPIVIFKIFKNKINIYMSMAINVGIIYCLSQENLLYTGVYVLIINLYLYELKRQHESELEIKAFIRGNNNEITYEVLVGNDSEAIVKGFLESEVSSLASISNNIDVKKEGIDKVLNTFRESMPQYEVLNSKDRKPNILVSLGLIFYLLFVTAAGSCGFILEDERQGTRERILMGRISERKYYISQCITFFIFTAVPSIEYYVICKIFDYEFGFNNTILLLIFALLMSLLAVAFSIMVTSIIKSKSIFNLVNAALTVPIFMLSGAFWDYKMMSNSLQNVGNILPPRWIFMAIEKLQAGAEVAEILPVISGIIGLSILFVLLSVFFTRNKMVLVKESN